MKTSKVLRHAKKHLLTTFRMGICHAISDAYYYSNVPVKDRERVMDLIAERIAPFAYATQWLAWQELYKKEKYPHNYYDIHRVKLNAIEVWQCRQRVEDTQAWRHAWLNQLIAEFEAKGD